MAHQPPLQFVPSIPRPADLDDDAPVPNAEVGGLTFMWSQANTLAKSMAQHLIDLQAEYAAATDTLDGGQATDLVDQLIDRFQTETKMVEQVRQPCCSNYNLSTLGSIGSIAPYRYTVLTLRTHLNCWLKMWQEHQKHRLSPLAEEADAGDKDKGKQKPQPAQHLKNWLAAIDKLPQYPETFPPQLEIEHNQAHVGFVPPPYWPAPQVEEDSGAVEEYSGPHKTADDRQKPKGEEPNKGQPGDILDHRTSARKATDLRARDRGGSVPKPPYPGVSLIAEGLKQARTPEGGGKSV